MIPASFELTAAARLDLLGIWNYLAEEASIDVADKVARDLEEAMERLATTPGLGHRRQDLTRRPVLFYLVHSYFIVYKPGTLPMHVLRVLHASRNVQRILEDDE